MRFGTPSTTTMGFWGSRRLRRDGTARCRDRLAALTRNTPPLGDYSTIQPVVIEPLCNRRNRNSTGTLAPETYVVDYSG